MKTETEAKLWLARSLPALPLLFACALLSAADPSGGKKGETGKKGGPGSKQEAEPAALNLGEQLAADPLDGKTLVCTPGTDRVVFNTWFDGRTDYYYEWGEKPDALTKKTETRTAPGGGAVTDALSGLKAGTRWYYRLRRNNGTSWIAGETGSFVTGRTPGTPFTFVIEADPHLDEATSPEGYKKNLAYMKSLAPDFVMDLGDSSMAEKLAKTAEEAKTRNRALRSFWDDTGNTAPFFMVLGNHDGEDGWDNPGSRVTTAEAAAIRRGVFTNPVPAAGGFYDGVSDTAYSFAWGDALIVVLDPFANTLRKGMQDNWDWTLGREQYDWLSKTLKDSNAKYTFVFIHNLVGGNGKDARGGARFADMWEWGGQNAAGENEFALKRPSWPMPIQDLLVKEKVDIVFHGHDHFYAREEKNGIIYQTVPQPSSRTRQNVGSLAAEYGYAGADLLPSPGFMLVSVTGEGATVELRNDGTNGPIRSYTVRRK